MICTAMQYEEICDCNKHSTTAENINMFVVMLASAWMTCDVGV